MCSLFKIRQHACLTSTVQLLKQPPTPCTLFNPHGACVLLDRFYLTCCGDSCVLCCAAPAGEASPGWPAVLQQLGSLRDGSTDAFLDDIRRLQGSDTEVVVPHSGAAAPYMNAFSRWCSCIYSLRGCAWAVQCPVGQLLAAAAAAAPARGMWACAAEPPASRWLQIVLKPVGISIPLGEYMKTSAHQYSVLCGIHGRCETSVHSAGPVLGHAA